MSKHTPGPWTYSYTSAAEARVAANDGTDGGGGNGLIMARQPGQDRTIVAILPYHRDPSEDAEREANACLLASAPKMLELIERAGEIMIELESLANSAFTNNASAQKSQWHKDVATLLDKIEGGGEG